MLHFRTYVCPLLVQLHVQSETYLEVSLSGFCAFTQFSQQGHEPQYYSCRFDSS